VISSIPIAVVALVQSQQILRQHLQQRLLHHPINERIPLIRLRFDLVVRKLADDLDHINRNIRILVRQQPNQ